MHSTMASSLHTFSEFFYQRLSFSKLASGDKGQKARNISNFMGRLKFSILYPIVFYQIDK